MKSLIKYLHIDDNMIINLKNVIGIFIFNYEKRYDTFNYYQGVVQEDTLLYVVCKEKNFCFDISKSQINNINNMLNNKFYKIFNDIVIHINDGRDTYKLVRGYIKKDNLVFENSKTVLIHTGNKEISLKDVILHNELI
ncbi:MAG: hypothetical protein [Wendovervirus sonii]|uniref:Uncharacterized protein n=1 Tax=phage Lak_Megaphage_Sonny TaxID=3109229 RepID=A0ABZ0Z2R2_9CAUD|nr:MAG: hypothetical protein [phage Lak_Megaphage_Sonny]